MEGQSSTKEAQISPSENARARLLSLRGEPLFIADWMRTLMIHYEVEPAALQQAVPFQLDLNDGRAFVSVVAFTLNRMGLRFGSRITAWLLSPIATHHFLNVRTYVTVNGESGIYFLAEWLSNALALLWDRWHSGSHIASAESGMTMNGIGPRRMIAAHPGLSQDGLKIAKMCSRMPRA